MKFSYTAARGDGTIMRGMVEAGSEGVALDFLARNGLKPITLLSAQEAARSAPLHFGGHITATDIIFLTKYLALMLRTGTDLFRALDILMNDFDKPAMKGLLMEIRESLEKGQPFYTTFARYPRQFDPVFVNLVKAGEISGNLESVFGELSVSLQKKEDLRRRISSALTYPIVLLSATAIIMIFLFVFVLPRLADVFMQGDLKPPAFSVFVFTLSKFMVSTLYIFFPVAALLGIVAWYFLFRTGAGRAFISVCMRHIPVVKKIVQHIAIQRFAATLSSLMRSGLPIIDSLDLTATAVGDSALQAALQRIAHEGIARGSTLGEAFRRERTFPLVISTLVAVSEKAGHLDEVLMTLSTFYESEIDSAIKSMVSLIEPLLLIILGGIVGFIALSVIVPIYQLIGQF